MEIKGRNFLASKQDYFQIKGNDKYSKYPKEEICDYFFINPDKDKHEEINGRLCNKSGIESLDLNMMQPLSDKSTNKASFIIYTTLGSREKYIQFRNKILAIAVHAAEVRSQGGCPSYVFNIENIKKFIEEKDIEQIEADAKSLIRAVDYIMEFGDKEISKEYKEYNKRTGTPEQETLKEQKK